MEHSDVDSVSLPPVRSLRSRFEQIAHDISPNANKRPISSHSGLLTPEPSSPRPRASSNSYSNSPLPDDVHHLRTSSSSSDLRVGAKRPPPPPPPPRGSKAPSISPAPSPGASPLLRPVPIPVPSASMPNVTLSSPRPGTWNNPTNSLMPLVQLESEASSTSPSVASLRNKFGTSPSASPPRLHTPRQSNSGTSSALISETDFANSNVTTTKPVIPPRPIKSIEPYRPSLLSNPLVTSPDQISSSAGSQSSLHSPFSDDDETNSEPILSAAPPALPARKLHPDTHYHHIPPSTSSGAYSSSSSRTSSENDASQSSVHPSKSSRLAIPPPPRPPPRHRSTAMTSTESSLASTSTLSPPPLPVRRSTVAPAEVLQGPPRLPSRPQLAIPAFSPSSETVVSSPSTTERKALGSGRLPPPPTRTIGLGDKLPPARRPPSPVSDTDSGDDEDDLKVSVDTLPDSSRSSRRPPVLSLQEGFSETKVHVPAHSGRVLVSGTNVIVATQHHIKIFDLTVSETPVFNLDTKEVGSKDVKITSMEFRPSAKTADQGYLLWLGTKEGHLFELDIRTGCVTGSKYSAHLHAITHLFRYGRSMITLDDTGKALIFTSDAEGKEDVNLTFTQPRVVRVTEKLDFVKVLDGKLWTAARSDSHAHGTPAKTPIIRVYDIFTPGSVGRSIMPTEHVGPVTSATIMPSQPRHVYMGHEEGFVTLWSLETDNGIPQCIEVMKVGASDVMSLEAVNNRLWAGGRNGMITAYDIIPRPWVVTNCWMAHPDLPVLRLAVDHYGIEKTGRLCVVSVGRDELVKLWDGLLGSDWIDQELMKRETTFSKFRNLNVLLVSWNVDAARPDTLSGDPANINFLQDVLGSVDSPDIISFGLQEVIDLESRKIVAKNVILGGKKKEDGGLSERVTSAYKRWYDRLLLAVRMAMSPDVPYSVVHTESLVGLFTCILIKNTERISLKDLSIKTIKRGMGGRYGNKGGILTRFVIEDSSICLINCHLAAGQNAVRQRNADIAAMLEEKAVFPVTQEPLPYVGGGDGSMVLDHEIVFVSGDMNYRIDQRRDPIIAAIRADEFSTLLAHDQLLKEIKYNRGCRLRGFLEGPLDFSPTYKYDPGTSDYDNSEKRRSPAWCDRVLWRSRDLSRVQLRNYQRYEANVSDHRPISAGFTITIKSVRQEVRQKVKSEVQLTWVAEQQRLLSAAREFYVSQSLI